MISYSFWCAPDATARRMRFHRPPVLSRCCCFSRWARAVPRERWRGLWLSPRSGATRGAGCPAPARGTRRSSGSPPPSSSTSRCVPARALARARGGADYSSPGPFFAPPVPRLLPSPAPRRAGARARADPSSAPRPRSQANVHDHLVIWCVARPRRRARALPTRPRARALPGGGARPGDPSAGAGQILHPRESRSNPQP